MTTRGPTLRIISVNDVYTLEHLPRLVSLVRHRREEGVADATLVVLAGDFLAPYLLSSLDAGQAMVESMNAVGVTHVVLGNHEDDVAPEALHARLRELQAVCLGTNVRGFVPQLPASQVVDVVGSEHGRTVRVGLVGTVMSDRTVYRGPPFGGVTLLDAQAAALAEAIVLVRDAGCCTVIPITHQSIKDDRALAQAWTTPVLPVIVGGHEHVVMVEEEAGTLIVKAGSDAKDAAIIDLTWSVETPPAGAPDTPRVSVQIEPVSAYPEDAALRELVDARMAKVHALEHAPLMTLAPGDELSSVGVRAKQTSMGALIASRLRDALGADTCLFNAGAIRAGRDYHGVVTYGDLRAEVPFDNEIVVVRMPGSVLREAVAASRAMAPAESGGFLQVDDGVVVEEPSHRVVAVRGEPFEEHRDYAVALVRNLLDGMDHVEPLARFGREMPERVPPHGSGREVKTVLVDAFARALWQRLGGFDAIDANHDGHVTRDEIAAAVARASRDAPSSVAAGLVLHALDTTGRGEIVRADVDTPTPWPPASPGKAGET